ncbi:unnamed protein product [Lampetra fluviatilis]
MVGLERASKMQNYLEHIISLRISRCQVKPSSMLLITTEPHIMMGCISPIELILLLLVTVPTLACPSACRCNGDFVYCNDRGLTSIPSGMPRNATTLYLQNNQINNAGIPPEMRNLLKVETVYLYSNRLEEFPINLPRNRCFVHTEKRGATCIDEMTEAPCILGAVGPNMVMAFAVKHVLADAPLH